MVPLADAVIYEMHAGTFTPGGTFDSAIERLDHLVALGITHVEVMPVAHFSGSRGWGYDGVDLYAPHTAYGGPEALKRFVDACHGRGLRVLLDVVYNHLGPSGNYTERFGPYFTERYHTPWGKALNYDQAYSDEVRRYVVDNVLMWLRDYRFDGLRLDAVHAILDQSAVHLLEQIAVETRALEQRDGPTLRHHRRERPQRPAPGTGHRARRFRARRRLERRLPSRPARPAHGRDGRLLRRLRRHRSPGGRPAAHLRLRRALLALP